MAFSSHLYWRTCHCRVLGQWQDKHGKILITVPLEQFFLVRGWPPFLLASPGTGKTSTLVKYAEKWSQSRFLYVTFNKSIAKQAELVFPSNVICKTFHSMAYGHIGRK